MLGLKREEPRSGKRKPVLENEEEEELKKVKKIKPPNFIIEWESPGLAARANSCRINAN